MIKKMGVFQQKLSNSLIMYLIFGGPLEIAPRTLAKFATPRP